MIYKHQFRHHIGLMCLLYIARWMLRDSDISEKQKDLLEDIQKKLWDGGWIG
jgi:hypothetical protein